MLDHQIDWLGGRTAAVALDRQSRDHACAFAQPAADVHIAIVQAQQAFHDRKPQASAVVVPVVSGTRLEKRFKNGRVSPDSNHIQMQILRGLERISDRADSIADFVLRSTSLEES